jgi:hypothetical protein
MSVLLAIALNGARADAQQQDPPRLTIAAGAGVAMPLQGDLDFTASEWQVSVRGRMSPHFALEGFFSAWRHDATRVLLNQAIIGPDGPLGRIARIEETTRHEIRVAGANALAIGSSGRVTVAAGGGVGILLFDRLFRQTSAGCDPADLCRTFETPFSNDSGTAQGVFDADAALSQRISVFGRFQFVVPLRDVTFSQASVAGGVRMALW